MKKKKPIQWWKKCGCQTKKACLVHTNSKVVTQNNNGTNKKKPTHKCAVARNLSLSPQRYVCIYEKRTLTTTNMSAIFLAFIIIMLLLRLLYRYYLAIVIFSNIPSLHRMLRLTRIWKSIRLLLSLSLSLTLPAHEMNARCILSISQFVGFVAAAATAAAVVAVVALFLDLIQKERA